MTKTATKSKSTTKKSLAQAITKVKKQGTVSKQKSKNKQKNNKTGSKLGSSAVSVVADASAVANSASQSPTTVSQKKIMHMTFSPSGIKKIDADNALLKKYSDHFKSLSFEKFQVVMSVLDPKKKKLEPLSAHSVSKVVTAFKDLAILDLAAYDKSKIVAHIHVWDDKDPKKVTNIAHSCVSDSISDDGIKSAAAKNAYSVLLTDAYNLLKDAVLTKTGTFRSNFSSQNLQAEKMPVTIPKGGKKASIDVDKDDDDDDDGDDNDDDENVDDEDEEEEDDEEEEEEEEEVASSDANEEFRSLPADLIKRARSDSGKIVVQAAKGRSKVVIVGNKDVIAQTLAANDFPLWAALAPHSSVLYVESVSDLLRLEDKSNTIVFIIEPKDRKRISKDSDLKQLLVFNLIADNKSDLITVVYDILKDSSSTSEVSKKSDSTDLAKLRSAKMGNPSVGGKVKLSPDFGAFLLEGCIFSEAVIKKCPDLEKLPCDSSVMVQFNSTLKMCTLSYKTSIRIVLNRFYDQSVTYSFNALNGSQQEAVDVVWNQVWVLFFLAQRYLKKRVLDISHATVEMQKYPRKADDIGDKYRKAPLRLVSKVEKFVDQLRHPKSFSAAHKRFDDAVEDAFSSDEDESDYSSSSEESVGSEDSEEDFSAKLTPAMVSKMQSLAAKSSVKPVPRKKQKDKKGQDLVKKQLLKKKKKVKEARRLRSEKADPVKDKGILQTPSDKKILRINRANLFKKSLTKRKR